MTAYERMQEKLPELNRVSYFSSYSLLCLASLEKLFTRSKGNWALSSFLHLFSRKASQASSVRFDSEIQMENHFDIYIWKD